MTKRYLLFFKRLLNLVYNVTICQLQDFYDIDFDYLVIMP